MKAERVALTGTLGIAKAFAPLRRKDGLSGLQAWGSHQAQFISQIIQMICEVTSIQRLLQYFLQFADFLIVIEQIKN